VTSEPMPDPATDPLLTAQNSALLVIDNRPSQIQLITSIDHDPLILGGPSRQRPMSFPSCFLLRCRRQQGVANNPSTQAGPLWLGRDRPYPDQLVGGHRLPSRRRGNGTEEVSHGGTVDRGVLSLPGSGRPAPGLRGLPDRRCRRRDLTGGTPGRARAHCPSGRSANRLGIARLRMTARLGSDRDRLGSCRNRAQFSTSQGALT
jgi:hypothetical protein